MSVAYYTERKRYQNLYKIILFYIKGICIALNVKKLLIH